MHCHRQHPGQAAVAVIDVPNVRRELLAAVMMSWLVFVRVLCVDCLESGSGSREDVRDVCREALLGAVRPMLSSAPPPAALHARGRVTGVERMYRR